MGKKKIYLTSLMFAALASSLSGCVTVEQLPESTSVAPVIEENIIINKLEYTEELANKFNSSTSILNIINSDDYADIDILLDAYKNSGLKSGIIKSFIYEGEEAKLYNYITYSSNSFWNVRVDEQLCVINLADNTWNQRIYDNGSDEYQSDVLSCDYNSGLDFLLCPDQCILAVREIKTDADGVHYISCDYAYEDGETGHIQFTISPDRVIQSIYKQFDNNTTPVFFEFDYNKENPDVLYDYAFSIDNQNIKDLKSEYLKSVSGLNVTNLGVYSDSNSQLLVDAYENSSNQYGIIKLYSSDGTSTEKIYDMLYDKESSWVIKVDEWWSFLELKNESWNKRVLVNGEDGEMTDILDVKYDSGLDFILSPDLSSYTITSINTDEEGNTFIVCDYEEVVLESSDTEELTSINTGYMKFKISPDGLLRHIYKQIDGSTESYTYEFSYNGEESFDGYLSDLLLTGFTLNNPKVDELESVYSKTSLNN